MTVAPGEVSVSVFPTPISPFQFDSRIHIEFRIEIRAEIALGSVTTGDQVVYRYAEPPIYKREVSRGRGPIVGIGPSKESIDVVLSVQVVFESAGGPELEFPGEGFGGKKNTKETECDCST